MTFCVTDPNTGFGSCTLVYISRCTFRESRASKKYFINRCGDIPYLIVRKGFSTKGAEMVQVQPLFPNGLHHYAGEHTFYVVSFFLLCFWDTKVPPLGASEASDDGEKKKAAGLGILWAAYISLLDTQPLLTKSLTSMTGFALGDLLAQKFLEKKVSYRHIRGKDQESSENFPRFR